MEMQGKPRIAEETASESFIHSRTVRKVKRPSQSIRITYHIVLQNSRFLRPIVGQGSTACSI